MEIRQTVTRPFFLVIAATTEVRLEIDRGILFDFVVAEDVLPKILTRFGLVPAVVATSGNTGPWDKPGSRRVVYLANGTTAREEVTAFDRPRYFSYRVSDFTSVVGHLASFAIGEWRFEEDGAGTRLQWIYTFHARGLVTMLLLRLFVRTQWLGYMRNCIVNTALALGRPPQQPA